MSEEVKGDSQSLCGRHRQSVFRDRSSGAASRMQFCSCANAAGTACPPNQLHPSAAPFRFNFE